MPPTPLAARFREEAPPGRRPPCRRLSTSPGYRSYVLGSDEALAAAESASLVGPAQLIFITALHEQSHGTPPPTWQVTD